MRLAMHGDGKDRGGGRFVGSSGRCSCRRSVGGRQILSGASVLGGVSQGGSAGSQRRRCCSSPGTVWSALAVNSCWRELAGSRPHAALARAAETGRLGRLVHSKLRDFYYCTSPLRRVLVNAASWMKLAEQTISRRLKQ